MRSIAGRHDLEIVRDRRDARVDQHRYLGLVSTDDTQPWVFDHISVESSAVPKAAPSATTTALTAWHDHQIVGRDLQMMAAVSVLLPPATGKITLSEGDTVLTTMDASSDGAALLSVSSLPVGAHSLVATYEGDVRNSKSSSAPATVTILPKRNAAVVATAGVNPLAANAKTTLSAAISVSADDLKNGAPYNAVTGWVQFMDGTQPLGVPQKSASSAIKLGRRDPSRPTT